MPTVGTGWEGRERRGKDPGGTLNKRACTGSAATHQSAHAATACMTIAAIAAVLSRSGSRGRPAAARSCTGKSQGRRPPRHLGFAAGGLRMGSLEGLPFPKKIPGERREEGGTSTYISVEADANTCRHGQVDACVNRARSGRCACTQQTQYARAAARLSKPSCTVQSSAGVTRGRWRLTTRSSILWNPLLLKQS